VSALTLINNKEPGEGIQFRISAFRLFYLAKKLYVYDPKSKKVVAEINRMNSTKDIDTIKLGHDMNSIAFIKDIAQFEIKNRRKPNFDGNIFYIPLGSKETYRSKSRRTSNMYTKHLINSCSLYLPIDVFDKFKLLGKGEKINNFTKEVFRRFRLEITDSHTSENFVITGKCNNTIIDLNKNKDMVKEIKDIVGDTYKWRNDFKLTQAWKRKLLVDLENFINKYEDYEVQK